MPAAYESYVVLAEPDDDGPDAPGSDRPRVGGRLVLGLVALLVVVPLAQTTYGALRPDGKRAGVPSAPPHPSGQGRGREQGRSDGRALPSTVDPATRSWLQSLLNSEEEPTPSADGARLVRQRPGPPGDRPIQVRTAAGRWRTVARGELVQPGWPDLAGRRLAVTVVRAAAGRHVRSRAVVVDLRTGATISDTATSRRQVVQGWFGDRVVLASAEPDRTPTVLRDPATARDVDLGGRVRVSRDRAGNLTISTTDGSCVSPFQVVDQHHRTTYCRESAVLAVSGDGQWAVTRNLTWTDLVGRGTWPVLARPGSARAMSASFLRDGRAVIDITDDGTRPIATIICRPGPLGDCTRVATRWTAGVGSD